ncbi:MAG: arsenosugar biosynthesis radical SAM protein ArsS [Phycisphaerales bacterium]|nr:arsenosugar biosynthesis radical SAM protein ArsS [Phycisphaerales bacterium]
MIALPILDRPHFERKFDAELTAADRITTLQINIGAVCNLACRHCHVESSPARTAPEDNMSEDTARRVVDWAIAEPTIDTVDITGGSPEMNPNFRWMVQELRAADLSVIDRCNPTIIEYVERKTGRSFEWIPQFLADHDVQVVASMPCYLEDNVERQRGKGAYNASVEGLRKLNAVGYGVDPNLRLNLVYNPNGASLPPPQESLHADYTRELSERFGLVFNELWTITNMPIKRWRHELERDGRLESYMTTLIDAFNPTTVEGLMCRHQVNIDPQGRIYDCDFNQALAMPNEAFGGRRVWETTAEELAGRCIATADHCYGCTAGTGSSCGGSLM